MNIYTILMAKNTKYQTFFPKLMVKDNKKSTSNYSQNRIPSNKDNKNNSIDNDKKYRLTYNDILHIPTHISFIKEQSKQLECPKINEMKTTFVRKSSDSTNKLNGYKIVKQIGKGGFAEVFQVRNDEQNNFAMKQYLLQNSSDCYKNQYVVGEHFFDKGKLKNKFALKRGGNNLISYVQKFKIGKKGYIIQQIGGKSLAKMISQIQGVFYKGQRVYQVKFSKFYEELALQKKFTKLILQIADGIKLLNQQGFIHCDLKPENILVNQNENETNCKIIDFGSSFIYNDGLPKITITPEYMPPQLLDALNSQNSTAKLNKIDIWSLGCIMLQIMTGIPLWFRYKCKINIKGRQNLCLGFFALTNRQYYKIIKKQKEMCQNIKKIQFVYSEFEPYRKIIAKILVFEESQRATIDEVIDMLQKII